MRLIRRFHMYAGITLVPWIILFGVTGVLFNHPNFLSSRDVIKQISSDDIKNIMDLNIINIKLISSNIIENINNNTNSINLLLNSKKDSSLYGTLTYSLNDESNRHYLYVNMNDLSARIESRPNSQKIKTPEFLGKKIIQSNRYDWLKSKDKAKEIFKLAGIESTNNVSLLSRSGPKILFNAKSVDNEKEYNLVYNLISNELGGRESGLSNSPLGFRSTLLRLHMLHTYPDSVNTRWLWSLAVDATGIMLILWGATGLIMWWQIKPTRLLGIISIFSALLITIIITVGTVKLITFDGPFRSSAFSNINSNGLIKNINTNKVNK